MYMIFKHIHMLMAVISIIGFIIRGGLKFRDADILNHKLVKILPHVIDTIFLLSALYLASQLAAAGGMHIWLTVKVVGLVLYILLGLGTMRFAKNNGERAIYFGAAILTFFYIISVAFSKDPLFFL